MTQASKTFRIFVSSTFSDLKEERNALQQHVFPKLRELCMQHGCRFQAIDLRWGVSEEAALDQQTMKICLEEIKRCQKTTPRPNFIILLGDRYGWRPLPYEIAADEFKQIESLIADQSDHDLLTHWYRRDDNAVLPVHCLQPRDLDLGQAMSDEEKVAVREAESAQWYETEAKLRRILLGAAAQLPFTEEQRLKYEASATEREIEAGALKVEDAYEHVFAFFRQFGQLPADEKAKDFVDLDSDRRVDQAAHNRLQHLKDRLARKPKGKTLDSESEWASEGNNRGQDGGATNTFYYETQWIGDGITTGHIEKLKQDVYDALSGTILAQIAQLKLVTPLQQEIEDHEKFGEDRARFFVGRQIYLDRIQNYLTYEAEHPLALYGDSGSGKSALMARAVADARKARSSARLIERYIGATPSSSDGRALLESLCKEITQHYGEDEQSVPAEYQKLVKDFQKRLELATQDKPLIIFLDALDQLSDNEHARNLAWLPNKLPPHVHVIVSTLPGECLTHLEQKLPTNNLLILDSMTSSEGDELLDLWLADAKRLLQPAQRESVLKEFMVNGLPLYLKLVFEEARRWKSYSLAQRFPADIPGMILFMFRRLMADHGLMLIERALGYIAAARHGLSEDELLDVLSMDKEVFDDFLNRAHHQPPEQRLPVVVWSRLYFDLEPYLTERSADGANLLGFYHRQLGEVVTGEFLGGEAKRERHMALGEFFAGQDYFLETLEAQRERARRLPPTARPANLRKASELAWQLVRAEQCQELEQVLTDLSFLEAKAEAGMVFDLAGDFSSAMKAIPGGRPQRHILLLLEEALRRDLHFIARHPTTLFQCLWNSCWWYDRPEAARHYETSDGPWSRPGAKLHELLEAWRSAREENYRGFYWVRSLRPPTLHLGTAQQAVLHAHKNEVLSVAYSPDGRWIVSGGGNDFVSSDRAVHVWEAATGREIHCLTGHDSPVRYVAYSPNGQQIISCSTLRILVWDATTAEKTWAISTRSGNASYSPDSRQIVACTGFSDEIQLLDAATGQRVHCLRGHTSWVTGALFSPDSQRIISGSLDGAIRVWDATTGCELCCLRGDTDKVVYVSYSPDGQQIASWSLDGPIRVWDIASCRELFCLRGHVGSVIHLSFSPDGRQLISNSRSPKRRSEDDYMIRVWDVANGKELHCLRGHTSYVTGVVFSPDSRWILSASYDGTLRLWDAGSGSELRSFIGHEGLVNDLSFAPDGQHIVSAGRDSTIRIWHTEMGETFRTLEGHVQSSQVRSHIENLSFSPDGCSIASGLRDNSIRVWNTVTGREVNCLRGHERGVRVVLFSLDGRWLLSWSHDGTIRLWDAQTGEQIHCLGDLGGPRDFTSASFSPNGRLIAAGGGWDKTVRVWDAASGQELFCLRGHENRVNQVCFSVDGQRIASGASDGVRVWDVESGAEMAVFQYVDQMTNGWYYVDCVAFSRSGKRIVAGSHSTVRVWDLSTHQQTHCLRGHDVRPMRGIAFSSDDRRVISGSDDGTVRVWDAESGECLQVIEGQGDVEAIAAGFNFRAIARGAETVIEDTSGRLVALFPVYLNYLATHPSGGLWAGASVNDVYVIALEGVPDQNRT